MSSETPASTSGHLHAMVIPKELETSTPLSTQKRPEELEYERARQDSGIDPLSSIRRREPSQSILKKTLRTPFGDSSVTYKGNEIPRVPNAEHNSSYYSVANDVSRNPALNNARAQKVLFSPTKEIVSYGDAADRDFHVDLMQLDRARANGEARNGNVASDDRKAHKPSFWASAAVDPRIPYVLSLYLQLFFNVAIVSVVLYLLYIFIRTVQEDVGHKIAMYTSDALQEISHCSRQFYRNRCSNEGTSTRPPALEETCMALEKCMNRDPQQLGKSRITAETFADIVNGFLHPISWKSCILFTGLIIGGVVVTNLAFGTYRSRSGIEEFVKRAQNATLDSDDDKNATPSRQNAQLQMASTPPNPPVQHNARVTEDSTLPFSSPLSSRSSKPNL